MATTKKAATTATKDTSERDPNSILNHPSNKMINQARGFMREIQAYTHNMSQDESDRFWARTKQFLRGLAGETEDAYIEQQQGGDN